MEKPLPPQPRPAPGLLFLSVVLLLLFAARPCAAQQTGQPPNPASGVPAPGAQLPAAQPPAAQRPAPDTSHSVANTPPAIPTLDYAADAIDSLNEGTGDFAAHGNVVVTFSGVTITADRVAGNFNRELIFSGNTKIEAQGAHMFADAIHVFPQNRSYRLDNPRGLLEPSLLQNRVLSDVFVRGGEFSGTRTGYSFAERFAATTCKELKPHYELRVSSAELFPHKRLVLRRVGVVFFGKHLITLPYLVIPLDRQARRARTDYLPEFGVNQDEGYFARFPYQFAEGADAATFVRLDATQKRGLGGRLEQEYIAGKQQNPFSTGSPGSYGTGYSSGNGSLNSAYGYGTLGARLGQLGTGIGPQNGGLFAMQGYFADGFDRNFNASYRHQQSIGGDNRFSLLSELTRNSFYTFQSQTTQNTRFDFLHDDQKHGVNGEATMSLITNNSTGTDTSQFEGTYKQSFIFDTQGSNRNTFSYNFDLSRYSATSTSVTDGSTTESQNAHLDSQFQLQHFSRDYSLTLQANKTTLIGSQTGGSSFGTLERLPELQVSTDTINFKGGWLHELPLHFDFGIGRYSEPSSNVQTERALLGFALQDTSILKGRTEMTVGGGFEQRLYGDGAAQYQIRDQVRLRQHLLGRSGIDVTYQYAQPEGGTPFLFDTYGKTHNVALEGGYLDDKRFQITARLGYDLLGTSSLDPWQTLSTRLMWRPTPSVRLDSLATFDPNSGKFTSFTNEARFRARNNFAIDLASRYDPSLHRFSEINTQFDIPVGRTWRLTGLARYSGYNNNFISRNLQISHQWDCLEASITYSDSPLGFTNNRQLFFSLRIKALPFFRSFARGPAGEAGSTGLGSIF